MQVTVGDRVRIRGLVQSDCLGQVGTVLETHRSAFFALPILRCKVDFNGRVRRILNIHLTRIDEPSSARSEAA